MSQVTHTQSNDQGSSLPDRSAFSRSVVVSHKEDKTPNESGSPAQIERNQFFNKSSQQFDKIKNDSLSANHVNSLSSSDGSIQSSINNTTESKSLDSSESDNQILSGNSKSNSNNYS